MKYIVTVILLVFVCSSCIREDDCPCTEGNTLEVEMKPVPYILEGDSVVGVLPYHRFVNRLDLLIFRNGKQDTGAVFDYEYCLEHPVIPLQLRPGKYDFLFAGNLLDHKALMWQFTEDGRLEARFSILDHQEPPLYLVSTDKTDFLFPAVLPVQLHIIVARIEVKLVNPPTWITGLDFTVSNIAKEVTDLGVLRDTTSLSKSIGVDYTGPGVYYVGLNAFPTYPGHPATVNVRLKGADRVSQFVIDDTRMTLQISRILQVSIEFETENDIKVSVEVNGKWEVIDEGKIEI